VADEVAGFLALLDSDVQVPVNIGNPGEFTMSELAELVLELTGSTAGVTYEPLPSDDPRQRQPDITRARQLLGWAPRVALREGLELTIPAFASELSVAG
jgi:nucleoside-diphosphate-sugar epimerase